MAHTFSQLFDHLIWSTDCRKPIILPLFQQRLYSYLGGILKDLDITLIQIGGMPDHVHLLTLSKPSKRICSSIIRQVKASSSKWLHQQFPEARNFAWQDGYGIFSVSYSQVPIVKSYIEHQKEHHKKQSFENEYFGLLRKHEIEFDPRFVLG